MVTTHDESVRSARDRYLAQNGFTTEGYTAPTYRLTVLGRPWDLPNRPNRRWAIPLHDLHHVATGYATDFAGEAEIGAWELAAGCKTPIVYALNAAAVLFGLFLAPLRVLRAFWAGRRARALYRQRFDYEALLDRPLLELRDRLGVPPEGLARRVSNTMRAAGVNRQPE
jgi:hypothetical protein